MEPRYDEPLYNEVLFLPNEDLFTPILVVKCIEKNLDITKAHYSQQILPVPWYFVISMFHCIVIFTRIESVETRSTFIFLEKGLLSKMLISESSQYQEKKFPLKSNIAIRNTQ